MAVRYWMVVASRDHVQRGVTGTFAQACHGNASPLRRMRKGDGILYSSSKAVFGENTTCQRVTAIGAVADETVAQADMGEGSLPFRRNVQVFDSQEAPITPLIPYLSFITDKRRWGGVVRVGLVEIPETDFLLIAGHMGIAAGMLVAS